MVIKNKEEREARQRAEAAAVVAAASANAAVSLSAATSISTQSGVGRAQATSQTPHHLQQQQQHAHHAHAPNITAVSAVGTTAGGLQRSASLLVSALFTPPHPVYSIGLIHPLFRLSRSPPLGPALAAFHRLLDPVRPRSSVMQRLPAARLNLVSVPSLPLQVLVAVE